MIRYFSIVIVLFLAFGISGCNKNSNELPPVSPAPGVLRVPLYVNGLERMQIIIRQIKAGAHDTLKVDVQNTGSAPIDTAAILIELCADGGGGWSHCQLQPVAVVRKLLPGKDMLAVAQYVDTRLTPGFSTVKAGLLFFGGSAPHPLTGIYDRLPSYADYYLDSVRKYSGYARGYVLLDGSATIHMKGADSAEWDVAGQYGLDLGFSGSLSSKGVFVTAVGLDSVRVDTAGRKAVTFFRDGVLRDSLRLLHSLPDNVNHINLYLTKNP